VASRSSIVNTMLQAVQRAGWMRHRPVTRTWHPHHAQHFSQWGVSLSIYVIPASLAGNGIPLLQRDKQHAVPWKQPPDAAQERVREGVVIDDCSFTRPSTVKRTTRKLGYRTGRVGSKRATQY
jgi:hypothetical protein